MPRRNALLEFRALLEAIRTSKRPAWRFRSIGISRRKALNGGACRGLLTSKADVWATRSIISFVLAPGDPRSRKVFPRIMRALGYELWEWGKVPAYYRYWERYSPRRIESEVALVESACALGAVPRRQRRKRSRDPARRLVFIKNQRDAWNVLNLAGRGGWKPERVFVQARRSVTAEGLPWNVAYEGYWEPSDPDRKGFGIGIVLECSRPISPDRFERLRPLIERMDKNFIRWGYDVPTRDTEPLKEKMPNWYTLIDKFVHGHRRYLAESRRLLHWIPT